MNQKILYIKYRFQVRQVVDEQAILEERLSIV